MPGKEKNAKKISALLAAAVFLLCGCGAKEEAAQTAPSAPPTEETAAAASPQGPAAEKVQSLLAPYEELLNQASYEIPHNPVYNIPGDMLRQLAQDAWQTGAEPKEGRYQFSWRQSGDYTYESTAWDAMEQFAAEQENATPPPDDDAPMDSQLNGDFQVSGGGLFERVRAYDAAEDFTQGTAEINDLLNGTVTGSERFSFALRDGELYFSDCTLNFTVDADGQTVQDGFLAAVGVLRAESLDILEYQIENPQDLPDPASVNLESLARSVHPTNRLTLIKEQ